jgi:hypothetical protein
MSDSIRDSALLVSVSDVVRWLPDQRRAVGVFYTCRIGLVPSH